jgi:uncharacterized protein (DUF433 family)
MSEEAIIVSDPQIMGGAPCFRGTRVPVEIIFDHLKAGYSLQHISEQWPTVNVADLKAAVEMAGAYLMQSAAKDAA